MLYFAKSSEVRWPLAWPTPGPYEILSAIGAGGMGDVYRARDTRVDRIGAIKVLPGPLADRRDLRGFGREARTVASLNHPHICTLFDIVSKRGQVQLDQLNKLSRQRYVSPMARARVYAGLGEKDRAIEWWKRVLKTAL